MFNWLRERRARRRAAFVADVLGIVQAAERERFNRATADVLRLFPERAAPEWVDRWLSRGGQPEADREGQAHPSTDPDRPPPAKDKPEA